MVKMTALESGFILYGTHRDSAVKVRLNTFAEAGMQHYNTR